MKKKGYKAGGGPLPMKKGPDGKMVPEFAMDGKGSGDMAKGTLGSGLGKDQPLLEMKKSLKGKKRNVSPEEVRARKGKKVEMQSGGPVPPKKKGYAKGGKVRGAGIARKGTRPCKMR